jgi:hypothetical protein
MTTSINGLGVAIDTRRAGVSHSDLALWRCEQGLPDIYNSEFLEEWGQWPVRRVRLDPELAVLFLLRFPGASVVDEHNWRPGWQPGWPRSM